MASGALGPKTKAPALARTSCPRWFKAGSTATWARRDQPPGGPLPGVFAEYVVAQSDSVLAVPRYLDDLEAACLPCAALTAWSALKTLAPIAAGDTVLTLGSGGVSLFALQIARLSGARVLATSRDPQKRERLLALGAEAVPTRAARLGRAARCCATTQSSST